MKRLEEPLVSTERAFGMAGLEFGDTFGDTAIDQGLGFENKPSSLRPRFEQVADVQADLLPHVLRDHDLILIFDGYQSHRVCTTVQLFIFHSSKLAGPVKVAQLTEVPLFDASSLSYTTEMLSEKNARVLLWALLVGGILAFGIGGAGLIYFHQTYPELRGSLILGKDLFVGFLTISAIAIAAENMRRTAAAARASVALRFVERWNDPKLAELRNQWHEIYYDLKKLGPAEIAQRLEVDMKARTIVTEMLNFCEEIAHGVNVKVADETLIRRLLFDTIHEYYSTLLPWIRIRRATRPDAWEAIKLMIER